VIATSRQTLIANVAQQICAAILILCLPNLLSKADYAQVVYVSVLLSFAAFADLGISLAYGRMVPALLAQENHDDVHLWNGTTLKFGLMASAIYSVILAGIYYYRYENIVRALLFMPVPVIVFWFSFHVGRVSSSGDFSAYRRAVTWRSLGSLTALPLVIFSGLNGWFVAQLFAVLLALLQFGKRLLRSFGALHWTLIRAHLKEGLLLSSINVLWFQLLYSARLYASFRYNQETLALYGLISSAYQSLSALVVSAFLPVSVGILSRYGKSSGLAFEFAAAALAKSFPWIMAGTIASIIAAPFAVRLCFPGYHVETGILTAMLLCIMFYPFFLTWGSCMVAGKRFVTYLLLLLCNLAIGLGCAWGIDQRYPGHGAAWGQLIGIMSYTFCLFFAISGKQLTGRVHE